MLDQAVLCTACGESAQERSTYAYQREEEQVEASWKSDKVMGILCYVFILIPLFSGEYKKSQFVKFHLNQATGIVIGYAVLWIIRYILIVVLTAFFQYGIMWRTVGPLIGLLTLLNIIPLLYIVLGAVNAAHEKMKTLPLFGNIKIFK